MLRPVLFCWHKDVWSSTSVRAGQCVWVFVRRVKKTSGNLSVKCLVRHFRRSPHFQQTAQLRNLTHALLQRRASPSPVVSSRLSVCTLWKRRVKPACYLPHALAALMHSSSAANSPGGKVSVPSEPLAPQPLPLARLYRCTTRQAAASSSSRFAGGGSWSAGGGPPRCAEPCLSMSVRRMQAMWPHREAAGRRTTQLIKPTFDSFKSSGCPVGETCDGGNFPNPNSATINWTIKYAQGNTGYTADKHNKITKQTNKKKETIYLEMKLAELWQQCQPSIRKHFSARTEF